jgi:hypothetical protein
MRRTGIRLAVIRTALVLAGALGAVLLSGAPALAGNWAVTSLDPLPDRIEPNRAYTIGFWVLQHGSHPYSGGVLNPVGLKFVAETGKTTTFPGVALPEPAHYAAAIILPAGTYQVFGVQGPFQDYRIATLAVPGGLTALAVPPPLAVGADEQPWGAIRPPQVPVDPNRDPFGDPAAAPGVEQAPAAIPQISAQPAAANPVDNGRSGTLVTVIVTAIATVAVIGAIGSALYWQPRARRLASTLMAVRRPRPRRELIG